MAISVGLNKKARSIEGVEGWPFRAVAEAMEVIPRTLVQNCGGNAIRILTQLRVIQICYISSLNTDRSDSRQSMLMESTVSEWMERLERS